MLGLICAIPEEIAHFGDSFQERSRHESGGLWFRAGLLEGQQAVLVEAGIGKVNAAMVATIMATEYKVHALLFSGVAGGLDPELGIGDVVVATRLIQHDYGALVDEKIKCYQPGIPPLPGFPEDYGYAMDAGLVDKVHKALDGVTLPAFSAAAVGEDHARTPRIHYGTVLTGDTFLNCEATRLRLFDTFGALCVEMEGAAVAQVAERFAVPCVVVRSLSDLAGADSHMDFGSFAHDAAESAAVLMRRLVQVV